MANNSPTIVAASLSDDQLKKSIDSLVTHVDEAMKKMVQSTNNAVGEMEAKLKSLGNIKIDSGGSADGGAYKRAKAQNEEIAAIKESTQAYKDKKTTLDQMAFATTRASRSASTFIQNERESLRMRQNEIQAKIDSLKKQFGNVEIKTIVRDDGTFSRAIDKAKQKIEEARRQLQNVPPTSALGKQFSQELQVARNEYNELIRSRKAFESQSQIKRLSDEYEQNNKKIRELATAYKQIYTDSKQAESAINSGTNAIARYGDSVEKAQQKMLKAAFNRAINILPQGDDLAYAKLERLKAILADHRFLGALSPAEIKRARTEVQNLEQAIGQVSTTQQQTTQTAQRYTEEIRRQAQAIRETQTWKEKGYAIVGEHSYYDPESSKASRKDVLSLEEQILKNTQQREEAEKKVSNVLKEEVETLNVARNGFKIDNSSKEGQPVKSIAAQKHAAEAAAKETNYLKEQVASLLDVEEREIKTANATSSSYAQLAQYLKHLQLAYQRLGADRIAKGEGTDIANEIQRTQRAMQKLQQTMSRPISFGAAMKGDEKTLDDIAYKMQRLRSYRQGIDLTKPNAANEIRQVDEALAKLQKDADKWMSKSNDMIKSNTALGRSWNYMKNRLAFYFTVGASTSFVKNLIEIRSQYEMNERALGILINSAERGTQIFSELSQMALVSPYTLIELSSAAKQLTAYDVAAKDVVDTTRRLADMAAAVGIPMERLTYALGQIKAYGYLNSRDARMFANAGIPLVKQLSDYYTEIEGKLVSTADIYDRIKKKAIDYNDVMQVIVKMTDKGGKFFDFQAKMADTLKVRLANLTLAWNNMMNDIGASQQGILTSGIGALRTLFLHWKDIYTVANQLALTLGSLKAAQLLYWAAVHGTNKAIALEVVLGQKLATTLKSVAISLRTLLTSPATWFFVLSAAITSAGMALWDAGEATKEFNKSIRDNASDSLKNLQDFEKQYSSIRDELYKKEKDEKGKETLVPQNTLDSNEAKKAWEAVRSEIELTSQASNEYIGYLISIDNIYDRLRAGFSIIDDIKAVKAELEKAGEEEIKMAEGMDGWWNAYLLPDGWIKNLKDYEKELDNVKEKWGDIEKARDMVGEARHANQINGDVVLNHGKANAILYEDVTDMDVALVKFQKDIEVTTRSIIDFINGRGWSKDTNKITEVFKQVEQQMIQTGNLTAQESSLLQLEIERGRSEAIKDALEKRIADEQNLLKYAAKESAKIEIQERINTLNEEYKEYETYQGRGRVLWSNYTKWMKEQHLFEMQQMFKGMTSQQIAELDFSKGNYADWAKSTAEEYAKTHGLSYKDTFDLLENYVKKANKWSIFIPLTISTEDDKSIYKQLEEYDKNADAAWKTMQRLDKRIQQLRKKGAKEIENSENVGVTDLSLISEDDKELTKAIEERTQAQKDYNEAVAKGGESKKENAADRKAAKQAESELAKALKDELSTIEKVRSIYKDLTKEGMSHANAVERATKGWEETVNTINRVLQKNGLQKLDLSKFAGIENPRELVNMLQSQLNALAGRAKPSEIKELQTKIQTLSVDADKYDLTKITKGLNSELDRLKEEYELAVSLDADPELGSMFADWMGIDMDNLPRTAEEYAKRYTDILNKKMKERKADIELPNLLNITDDDLRELQNRVGTGDITQTYVDEIIKGVKAVREILSKELTSAINNYGKLLDKYGEYVVKVRRIEEEAATERKDLVMRFGNKQQKSKGLQLHTEILEEEDPVARQKLVDDLENLTNEVSKANPVALKINASIGNSENEKLAQASFEEFQKSREWVIATGDLATLSRSALGMLIREIEKYKKTAKNLTPKQIKAINNTLKQLKREVRKNNPFAILKNTIEDSKERMAGYQSDMETVMDKIIKYEKKIGDRKPTEDEQKDLDALKQEWEDLYEKMKTIGSNGWDGFLQGLSAAMEMTKQATSMFTDMFSAFGDDKTVRDVNRVLSVIDKTMQGAMMGTAIAPGYGTIIGAAVGLVSGLVTTFADQWSGNKAITESVQESERAVKRLVNAYKMLEYAAEQAFGAATSGAQQALKANKELQLFELRRQLALEESRSGKNYDEDKVLDLKGQIIDLEHEVKNFTKDAVNDLLGISSHGDFFEDMISEMIDAFKSGEDAMKVFEEKWSKMIDNMIMKTIVSQVLQNWVNSLEKGANDILEKYTKEQSDAIANMNNKMTDFSLMDARDAALWVAENDKKEYENILNQLKKDRILSGFNPLYDAMLINYNEDIQKRIQDAYIANMQSQINGINSKLDKASLDATGELIDYYGKAGEDFKANYLDVILDKIKENWNFGQDSENKLSQLQQGIQGITEDQAGALEAYWNANTQQQYVQSDLLREIRNLLAGGDADIQTGVQAQMLLQLQQSYQVQMSIENILQGALNPSGRAFSVQLIS